MKTSNKKAKEIIKYVLDELFAIDGPLSLRVMSSNRSIKNDMFRKACKRFGIPFTEEDYPHTRSPEDKLLEELFKTQEEK